jgi:hypothetical protein
MRSRLARVLTGKRPETAAPGWVPGRDALLARLAQRERRELTRYQGAEILAVLDDDATPWRMPARAADAVAAALDEAGVPYFATQPAWSRATQWAVRRRDVAAVVESLRRTLGPEGFYYGASGGVESPRLVAEGLEPADLANVRRLAVFQYVRCTATRRLYGPTQGTSITIWDEDPETGRLAAAVRAGTVQEVDASEGLELVGRPRWDGIVQPRLAIDVAPTALEVDFPVDAVYLWVDDSDPRWRAKRDAVRQRLGMAPSPAVDDETLAAHRFRDPGELRASLRSLETYAPWIRRIYLVTDEQRPEWLDVDHGRITVVDHREIFADPSVLPSYNSHAIGSQIHRIPDLADHYLLMNDDVMFSKAVSPSDFFTPQGMLRINFSPVLRAAVSRDRQSDLELARSNAADLLERDYGRRVANLFGHVPVPQRKDIALELEDRYGEEIRRTVASPFRSPDDVVVNSFLHLYTALFTGRGVQGGLKFGYFNIGRPEVRERMDRPETAGSYQVLCVNDVPARDGEAEADPEWLAAWLERTFPFRTTYELDQAGR